MAKPLLFLALCCALLAGCTTSSAPAQSRDERVRAHFAKDAESIAEKESLASSPAMFYRMVDEERLDDGTVRSLWATNPGHFLSRCFYLDVEGPGRVGGFVQGYGGCGGGTEKRVVLNGNASEMVGDVGAWPATKVRIRSGGAEAVVPVVNGFFLMPERLVKTGVRVFTIVLLEDALNVLAEISDVKVP